MNRLSDELSPYLRQHADNPVDWFPWGEAAFEEARQSNKPILLSIGYSACHWCHVMAHESFEDQATAELMNRLFVNVKVDREERPDVDEVYMAAVTALTGHGGWPMTVFLTPDGAPFYAGTYFPPEPHGDRPSFGDVMRQVSQVWQQQRDEVLAQSEQIVAALQASLAEQVGAAELGGADRPAQNGAADRPAQNGAAASPDRADPLVDPRAARALLRQAVASLRQRYDPAWGGFGMAPKFPQSDNLELLLRQYHRTGDTDLLYMVENTFDAMSSGGIYDHLGGGFARYSVDRQWLVPHFEKMLYDNALLARLGLHLWQITGKPRYRQVAQETIEYALGQLRHPDGGFYSAQDADSQGEEGKYYVWSAEEFEQVARRALGAGAPKLHLPQGVEGSAPSEEQIGAQTAAIMQYYGVTPQGNFEGSNILWRPQRGDLLRPEAVEQVRRALLEVRSKRVPPGLDNKALTEWNALMLATLAKAAAAWDNPEWLQAAQETAGFLCDRLRRADGRWLRVWQPDAGRDADRDAGPDADRDAGRDAGRARYLAYALDYAALLDAFLCVYEATGQPRWVDEARQVADGMLELFWDDDSGGLFTVGSDGEQLIVRAKDVFDNSQPSANSAACFGLLRLSHLSDNPNYRRRAEIILHNHAQIAQRAPSAFGHLLCALDFAAHPTREIVISGDLPELVAAIGSRYLPDSVFSWGEPLDISLWQARQDTAAAYVCSDGVCQAPAHDLAELEAALARA